MMMELYWHLGTNNPKYKMGGALAAAVSVALGYQDGFFAAVEHHWQLDATGADEGFDERDREDDVPGA